MNTRNNRGRQEKPGSKYLLNERIRATQVRVVEGMPENDIYHTEDAIKFAKEQGLDLVLISANASPPVCKVIDFNKFLYQEKQREKEQKDKQVKIVVKEIKFTPNIGENDYEVKKKKIIEFLEDGNKVKASVFFKGRNIMFKDRGELILAKLAVDIEEYGIPETVPKMESRNRMGFLIKSKKKNK